MVGLTGRHAELLEARGLDIELLARLGIESSTQLGDDTIAIPFFRGDQVVGTKYRTIAGDKRFSQAIGSEQIFYNRNALADETLVGHPIIVCEGEVDCWSALQSGFLRSVSVPAGAPQTEVGERASAKYQFIDDMPPLDETAVVILAVDGDEAGSALRADLALRFGARRCKWVKYPKGCKDLNDALRLFGTRGVVETLNRAQWLVGNVFRMSDIPPVPEAVPYMSGFPGLDDHYRLRLGDLCIVTGVPSAGKALAIDTPIATPVGWSTMGDLTAGDEVFDETGQRCRVVRVTKVMRSRPCWRVRFLDGSELIADSNHQWFTISETARRSARLADRRRGHEILPRGKDQSYKRTFPSVVTTEQISNSLISQGKYNHHVPLAGALVLPEVDLPIHPYAFGYWLGDGYSASARITVGAEDAAAFIEQMKNCGVTTVAHKGNGASMCYGIGRTGPTGGQHRHADSIERKLRLLGILGNKHIPALYLRSSVPQRKDLLRGLLDSDGHCTKRGQIELTLTKKRLAYDAFELMASLGLKPTIKEGRAQLRGKDCGPRYRIAFTSNQPVFPLARKHERQPLGRNIKYRNHTIIGCDATESVPVKCIEVDSPSRLYLAGRAMIPTHNSAFIGDLACRMAMRHKWPVCFASFEQEPTRDHRRMLRSWYGGGLVVSLDQETLDKADRWINDWFSFVVPDTESQATLPWVMERMAAAAIRFNSRLFVIDPWNEIEHDRPDGVSLTEYVGMALREFRGFARKYEAHVIVAAHPAKMRREQGKFPIPTLYDISDSAHFANRADVGIVIHRDGDETLVRIAKSRYHDQIGKPGDIKARYVWQKASYESPKAEATPYNERVGG